MGAAQSDLATTPEAVGNALPELEENGGASHQGLILYKYLLTGPTQGVWTIASKNAVVKWYDTNEGSTSKAAWYLEIEAGDVDLLIGDANELQADLTASTATFYDAENSCVCKLQFPSRQQCAAFSDTYNQKLYENLQADGTAELGKQGDWFFKSADAEPMDWEEIEDVPPPSTPKGLKQAEAVESKDTEVHALAMGAGANSFMVQDNKISVLSNQYGAVRSTDRGFVLTPPRGASVESFTPSRVMLMKGETEMNMLTPGARDKVYQADLERGSVIRQWTCKLNGVDVPMADITNDTRDAQLDERSTFLGLDANRLCRWDQRTAEGVVQDLTFAGGKDYSRGTNFTCMATSGDGYVAVGSRDGRVRLYGSKKGMSSYEFKQAVSSVPGLGLPITAIDVSYDGRYVVATTDRYLLIIQTFFKDAKGNDTNAFLSRLGSQMPAPRLLKLKPEDRIKVGAGACFSKGKLTWITEHNMTERWIAAGCGNYTVLWNFRRVKQQKPTVISSGAFTITDHYTMIAKDEKVVQNAFLHDKFAVTPQAKNALVVATEHRVYNCVDEDSDFD